MRWSVNEYKLCAVLISAFLSFPIFKMGITQTPQLLVSFEQSIRSSWGRPKMARACKKWQESIKRDCPSPSHPNAIAKTGKVTSTERQEEAGGVIKKAPHVPG